MADETTFTLTLGDETHRVALDGEVLDFKVKAVGEDQNVIGNIDMSDGTWSVSRKSDGCGVQNHPKCIVVSELDDGSGASCQFYWSCSCNYATVTFTLSEGCSISMGVACNKPNGTIKVDFTGGKYEEYYFTGVNGQSMVKINKVYDISTAVLEKPKVLATEESLFYAKIKAHEEQHEKDFSGGKYSIAAIYMEDIGSKWLADNSSTVTGPVYDLSKLRAVANSKIHVLAVEWAEDSANNVSDDIPPVNCPEMQGSPDTLKL